MRGGNREMSYWFGVDIGGTTVKIGLFRTEGELLDKWEIPSRTENEGEAILPDIAQSVLRKIGEDAYKEETFIGIGVGVPAPVTEDGIVNGSANLGWKYKEVKQELETLTGLSVKVGNDANVAALGEMWQGGGSGEQNMVMVTLGTGVGGGVIVNGKVVTGAHGAGGEIGHICVNYSETQTCGCGNRGCMEQYAFATGIVRLAKEKLEASKEPSVLREKEITAKEVFDAVKAGDKLAQEVAVQFGEYLGCGIANLAAVADPAVIVIGGGVSKAGEVLIPYIQKPYREHAFFANKEVEFVLATLGNDAGMCGAAKLIIDEQQS